MAVAKFSGLASGIDSAALIDSIVEARQQANVLRRKQIDEISAENDALDQLNTKILALNDLIDKLRTANGGGISKRSSSSDFTVATASASSSANVGSIGITVTSVASAATASFNDSYSSLTQAFAPNASGTQTIGVDVGLGGDLVSVDVDITSATTVAEYVDAFNANSNASGRVSAAVVNTGTTSSPSYRVVFTALKTGEDLGTIAFDVPGPSGFGASADLQNRTIDPATDAVFTVDGILDPITRSSNSVSDVFTGVTFNLQKAGSATITVSNDLDTTLDNFKEIIEAYNDLVNFVNENSTVTSSGQGSSRENVFGSLAKSRVDNDFLAQFRAAFAGASASSGTSVTAFSEMGISTNRDGTLALDEEKFKNAVAADPSGAEELIRDFADSSAGVDGFMYEFTKFDGFIDIAQASNSNEIDILNASIDQLDRRTAKLRENLEGQFSRLESLTANLQNTQSSLTSILAGLSR